MYQSGLRWNSFLHSMLLTFLILGSFASTLFAQKNILFLAGQPSHGYGKHEHRAGCLLLAEALNNSGLDIKAKVISG